MAGDGASEGVDGSRGSGDVFRVGNLLRMAVMWILCLVYSYAQYHVIRLRRRPQSWRRETLDFRFRDAQEPKPACIVTGASSGIGRATATALARRGFHVILAGRSLARLEIVRAEIEAQSSSSSCQALILDLSSVPSILQFARTVKELFQGEDAPGKLQLLVNNAGIIAASHRQTPDTFDVMTATNYLGPYLLTRALLPLLQAHAPHARIVNLASFTHRGLHHSHLNLSHLQSGGLSEAAKQRRTYYPLAKLYEASKLFLILHTYHLHRQGLGVSMMAADPGFVSTALLREVPGWLVRVSFLVMRALRLWQAPADGAAAVVAAAVAPWEASGEYVFGDEGVFCRSASFSYDVELGRRLWEASEQICEELVGKYGKREASPVSC